MICKSVASARGSVSDTLTLRRQYMNTSNDTASPTDTSGDTTHTADTFATNTNSNDPDDGCGCKASPAHTLRPRSHMGDVAFGACALWGAARTHRRPHIRLG